MSTIQQIEDGVRQLSSEDRATLMRNAERMAFEVLQKVVDATTDVFGNDVRIKSDWDPAFPDDKYTVFCVDVAGSPDEIVRMEEEWARRVNALVQGVDSFRLSIRPKP